MGKLGKLIQKLLRDPPELSYDDVMQDLSGCISTSESLQEAMNILRQKNSGLKLQSNIKILFRFLQIYFFVSHLTEPVPNY